MLEDEEAMKAEVEEWDAQKIPSSFKNYKRETSVRDANHIFQESHDSPTLLQKNFQSFSRSRLRSKLSKVSFIVLFPTDLNGDASNF